ncbi:hypothetical protein ACA910_013595 [Epithemia clementina (nom. ined.)]
MSSLSYSTTSSQQFHSHALLHLEEAKQILINVETMQTVELPRLQQEQCEHHDRIRHAKLELQEIQSQVDQAKQELERLNQSIPVAAAAAGAQDAAQEEVEENHNISAEETQQLHAVAVTTPLVDHSLVACDDDASKTTSHHEDDDDTTTSFDLLLNVAMSITSSSSYSGTSIPARSSSSASSSSKKRRVRRAYESPKKWRRMIRTRRLQSILLQQ